MQSVTTVNAEVIITGPTANPPWSWPYQRLFFIYKKNERWSKLMNITLDVGFSLYRWNFNYLINHVLWLDTLLTIFSWFHNARSFSSYCSLSCCSWEFDKWVSMMWCCVHPLKIALSTWFPTCYSELIIFAWTTSYQNSNTWHRDNAPSPRWG